LIDAVDSARLARMSPERIVCLTGETTELLYLLGEERRIVGISGFAVRPPRARREKARVSAFTSAKIERIIGLRPDLVLGFSNLQADIAAAECRANSRLRAHVGRDGGCAGAQRKPDRRF
jgi:ABC-type hemin transport system substrate-binding protein